MVPRAAALAHLAARGRAHGRSCHADAVPLLSADPAPPSADACVAAAAHARGGAADGAACGAPPAQAGPVAAGAAGPAQLDGRADLRRDGAGEGGGHSLRLLAPRHPGCFESFARSRLAVLLLPPWLPQCQCLPFGGRCRNRHPVVAASTDEDPEVARLQGEVQAGLGKLMDLFSKVETAGMVTDGFAANCQPPPDYL
eukprot:289576-Prymnesium_polylepis.1